MQPMREFAAPVCAHGQQILDQTSVRPSLTLTDRSGSVQPLRESLRAHARLRGVAAASLLLPSAADAPGLARLAAPAPHMLHLGHTGDTVGAAAMYHGHLFGMMAGAPIEDTSACQTCCSKRRTFRISCFGFQGHSRRGTAAHAA